MDDEIRVGDRFVWNGIDGAATWTVKERVDEDVCHLVSEDGGRMDYLVSLLKDRTWTRMPREQADEVAARLSADWKVRDPKGWADFRDECAKAAARVLEQHANATSIKAGEVVALTPGDTITLSSGPPAEQVTMRIIGAGTSGTLEWSGEPRTITLPASPPAKPKCQCQLCGEPDHGYPASMAGSCPNYGTCGPLFCLKGPECDCPVRRAGKAIIVAARRSKPKCHPHCTPAVPCMTAEVCPAFWESEVATEMAKSRGPRLWPFTNCIPDDVWEAREWRSQRYEPGRNGLGGGFVGAWNKRAVR